MKIAALYQLFIKFPRITTDSRNIPPDSIYIALKGDKFDGNTYAAQALEKGAKYAVIDNKAFLIEDRTILVENCLETLQKLANYHRRKLALPIIAITGTNGKTTTKELIRIVLSKKYNVLATQGNLNNHIGVPLTLLAMNSDTQIGVVEMGANHPHEIELLCKIAEPDFGLITNIGKAHLEGFGDFQGVIKTKKELYDYIIAKQGTLFYNSDNSLLTDIIGTWDNIVSYGPQTGKRCKGHIKSVNPYLEVEIINVTPNSKDQNILAKTNLVGSYNFENILAAACIGLHFDVPLAKVQEALVEYTPTNNRSQLSNTGKNQLLLDCYNANPSSTEAAILNFSNLSALNKIIVLGDMLELGEESEKEHLKIMSLLANYPDIKVLLVGNYYKSLAPSFGFTAFFDVMELCQWLTHSPILNSYILIKGSRGIQLEKIIDFL